MKVQIIYLAVCSIAQSAYISRMSSGSRIRGPTPFRPGLSLQRPWMSTRLVQMASNRAPQVLYRHPPNRYAMKHYSGGSTRNVFKNGPWKTTARLPPLAPSTEYDFVKAASVQSAVQTHGGRDNNEAYVKGFTIWPIRAAVKGLLERLTSDRHVHGPLEESVNCLKQIRMALGLEYSHFNCAIHTIPAPNLSLSEKPIVVMEATERPDQGQIQATYEVTEKYQEAEFKMAKIETPVGFSKATPFTSSGLHTIIHNGPALQFTPEFGLPINMQTAHIVAQQYPMHGFSGLPTQQDLVNTGAEGIFIPPNPLIQSDPMFLQKLHTQLLQRFPAVEFIPYPADFAAQAPHELHLEAQATQNYPQVIMQSPQSQNNEPIVLNLQEQLPTEHNIALQNQEVQIQPQATLQAQASQTHQQVVTIDEVHTTQPTTEANEQKTVFQRATQSNNSVAVIPTTQFFNVTEKREETTLIPEYQNITQKLISGATEPVTTTTTYVTEMNNSEQNTTPIYYAQIGQHVGNVIANGFYSAINDVRAAAILAQVDKPEEIKRFENITTTTLMPDLKAYFVQSDQTSENKTELKPLLGVPFKKTEEAVNVAYTLLRTDEKEPKMTQEGAVYAGQIVEATISEDQDFNKEKANLISKRAPIRLYTVSDLKDISEDHTPTPKVVKAKIPPKSKLIFDDKTGEPVLRIYASYVDNPEQRDAVITKLTSLKQNKDQQQKNEVLDSFKGAIVKSADKTLGFEANQLTQFGLKLKSRSDDYIPLFEEYDY